MPRPGLDSRTGSASDALASVSALRPPPGALPNGCSRQQLVTEVTDRLADVPAQAHLIVACSGGPDSTAVAYLVAEARDDVTLTLVYVGHGLRGPDAEARDRAVVATHAAWLGAGLEVTQVEVVPDGSGIEAAARDARYTALREIQVRVGASAIVLGHSADDQAETVVLRLARGTGLDGLAAMAADTDGLLRPLLRIRRADLHRYVKFEGLPTSEDETNQDEAIWRVRVRRQVLPALNQVGPDPVGALTRLADLARDDVVALDTAADDLPGALRWVGPVAVFDNRVLQATSIALARRVVRRAFTRWGAPPPSALTVDRILAASPGSGATLPEGLELLVDRTWRTLTPTPDPGADGPVNSAHGAAGAPGSALVVPGSTPWAPASLVIRARAPDPEVGGSGHAEPEAGPYGEQISLGLPGVWMPPTPRIEAAAVLPGADASRCWVALPGSLGPLQVTVPVPGDRITTDAGTRRVVEIFREAGVPRALRARWPIVRTSTQVVWIPGLAVDAHVAAAGRAAAAMALHLAPLATDRPIRGKGRHR